MVCIAATLLVFGLSFVAGCGNSGKAETPQGNAGGVIGTSRGLVDPGTLLTRADAEAALGEQVKEPDLKDTKNPLGQKICFYAPVSDQSGKFIQISVVQNEGMGKSLREQGYNVAQLYNETQKNLTGAKPVPGIGDEAFWGTNGLHILKGNVYLTISVGNTSRPENLEMAKRLAEKAVSRLGGAPGS